MKYATEYHYSSTMANGLGQSQKHGKQNMQQTGITNNTSNTTSSTPYSHDEFNGNIDISSGESLSIDKSSSTNSALQYATNNLIRIQPVSSPHSTNILDTNVTVDDDAQSYETTRGGHNGATETSAQIFLGSDSLQYQHNNTTHGTCQKLPTSGK